MTTPTQAQIEAARRELVSLVVITGDSTWDMDYVARRVLTAAAQVGSQIVHVSSSVPLQVIDEAATIERCAQVADAKAAEFEKWSHQDNALSPLC